MKKVEGKINIFKETSLVFIDIHAYMLNSLIMTCVHWFSFITDINHCFITQGHFKKDEEKKTLIKISFKKW